MKDDLLTVALAEISPIWMDREATVDKVVAAVKSAASNGASLVVTGEALVPGYPFWLALTGGAEFDSPVQKELFSAYSRAAVTIEDGHLERICKAAGSHSISVYLGIVERPRDRSGHSLYCSLVFIDANGEIRSVHRKLQPTYEERLVWAPGDGNGLVTHRIGPFTAGGLNCWENWMPLARVALQSRGEDLHVSVWPGSLRNTKDIARFAALESRSYSIAVSGRLSRDEIPVGVPHRDLLVSRAPEVLADGGSCVAAPDGSWVLEPQSTGVDRMPICELDADTIRRERQNFDPSGHYARPDVLKVLLNSDRQATIVRKSSSP